MFEDILGYGISRRNLVILGLHYSVVFQVVFTFVFTFLFTFVFTFLFAFVFTFVYTFVFTFVLASRMFHSSQNRKTFARR